MTGVPFTFATATTAIPLSELDVCFATQITIGSTLAGLGNVVSDLAGLGNVGTNAVVFPAVQVPSSNPNTLDDYEEGTFVPTDASGAGLTFSAAAGTYVKIGRLVWVALQVTYPLTSDASGAAIGSLPFVADSTSGVNMQSLSFGGTNSNRTDAFVINRSTANVLISNVAGAGGIPNSAYSGKFISVSGSYFASA